MKSPLGRSGLVLSVPVSLTLAAVLGATPQGGPLNLPLSRLDGGSVLDARISADGSRVVYAADQNVIGEVELFSVPLKGDGPSLQLSPRIPGYEFVDVESWKLSPDGQRVVYVTDDLYSVPIDRRALPVRLSDPLVPASSGFEISSGGTRVVFRAGQSGGYRSLYSVPIDGSAPPVLLQAASSLGGILQFEISPDGASVVFPSFHEDGLRSPLYSVPIAGGTAIPLSHPTAGTGRTESFPWRFTSTGEHVVFLSALEASSVPELYTVSIDGSSLPQRLNGALASGGSVLEFELSPDRQWVVYLADQNQDGKQELFGVPVDGSVPARVLNAPLASDRDVGATFVIHPSSRRVAYAADLELDNRSELYWTAIDGSGTPIKLNPPLSPDDDVGWFDFSPDGRTVVLTLHRPSPLPAELWRVSLARLAKVKLTEAPRFDQLRMAPDGRNVLYKVQGALFSLATAGGAPRMLTDGNPLGFEVDPQGARVLVAQPQWQRQIFELYSIPIDASQPLVKINGPLVQGEIVADVASFQASADGRWLVYHMQGLDSYEGESVADGLVSVRTDGSQPPMRLYPALAHLRMDDIVAYRIDSSSRRVVFLAGDDLGEFDEEQFYSAPIDGSALPVALNDHHIGMRRFELSPDGEWLVYASDTEPWSAGIEQLFASRTDGTAIEVELSGALAELVNSFAISPDGGSVVFIARRTTGSHHELLRVPIDGSAPPLLLATPLVAGGDVLDFQIDPSSRRVVYRGDLMTNQMDELWSVPLAGGVAGTRLNAPLVAGGDVVHHRITSDGSLVVYSADQVVDQAPQLFAVPITGGTATSLTPPPVVGATISALQIAPGAAQVVYVADATTVTVRELFVASTNGAALPFRLSGALVPGGDVQGVPEVSRDGSRVVFLADARENDVVELFSARMLPDAPRVQLSGALAPGGDVLGLRISPDGLRVAYVADALPDQTFELFGVPIEGGTFPRRLCDKLGTNRDVELAAGFGFDAQSQRVFYVADELADEMRELFAGSFAALSRSAR